MRKNKTINVLIEDNENEFIIPPKKMVILSKIKNNENKCSNKPKNSIISIKGIGKIITLKNS
jgi:hypothetical protein